MIPEADMLDVEGPAETNAAAVTPAQLESELPAQRNYPVRNRQPPDRLMYCSLYIDF